MRSIALLVLVLTFVFAGCGPRDDESLLGGGFNSNQGFDLNSGQVLTVTEPGQKLQSCRDDDQPTWNTVRIYKETSFIYDKVDELKVLVGRGDFNCVPVSKTKAVEVEVQEESWRGTGVYYYVTKLEMHNRDDFLANNSLVKKTAEDMAMSEAQLRTYLTTNNDRPQITLTFLEPADGSQASQQEDYQLESGYVLSAQKEGVKLPTCNADDDPTWNTIRAPFEFKEMFDKLADVSVMVSTRSRNCVSVSTQKTVEMEIQNQDKGDFTTSGQHFLVNKLSLVNRQYLLSQSDWVGELATQMQVSVETLTKALNADGADEVVSISYLTASSEVSEPVATPIKELRWPEDAGATLSDCNSPWTDIRLGDELKSQVQEALAGKTLKAIVNAGDRNCLAVGSEISLAVQEEGIWVPLAGVKVKVVGVMSMDKSYLQTIPFLAEKLSEEMGVSPKAFGEYTESLGGDAVNVTRLQWVETP